MSHSVKRNQFPKVIPMPRRRREAAPDLFSLRCQQCGRLLVRTTSGYLACERGHGGLQIELDTAAPCDESLLFPDTLENAG